MPLLRTVVEGEHFSIGAAEGSAGCYGFGCLYGLRLRNPQHQFVPVDLVENLGVRLRLVLFWLGGRCAMKSLNSKRPSQGLCWTRSRMGSYRGRPFQGVNTRTAFKGVYLTK